MGLILLGFGALVLMGIAAGYFISIRGFLVLSFLATGCNWLLYNNMSSFLGYFSFSYLFILTSLLFFPMFLSILGTRLMLGFEKGTVQKSSVTRFFLR